MKMATAVSALLSPMIPESRTTQAILIGAVIAVVVHFLTKKRYKYPPGPRGLPLLGNLLSLQKKNILQMMPEWEKQYGPVVTVNLGPLRTVILNRLDVIQEAFVRKSTDFAGRAHLFSIKKLTEGFKDIAGTDYGPTWQLHRRLALKALGYYMKGTNFEETLDEVLKMVFEEMRKEKDTFNIQPYTELLVFNLLSEICFSEKVSKDDKEFQRISYLLNKTNEDIGNGFLEDIFPPLRLWPTKKFRNVVGMFEEILEFVYKKINHHKATFSPDIQRDFTDAMLIAQNELRAEENPDLVAEITDTHFAQTVIDIFGAGIDTSRQTLYWTILYLAANPDVQRKIHKEVDSVLGARVTPVMSDRSRLPYTEAVLFESMRLATVAPFAVPHSTTCDTTIANYEIPKGTFVMANLFAVHHDQRLWEEPMKFKPERFLDSSGNLKPKPEGWMPFSIGKRACMAESLAKPELHMILAGLYRNFEIHMPEGVKADVDPGETGFVYLPKPYEVVIKDRFA